MTIYPACSGSEEGPGANFTPPTLGNFMEKQKNDNKRLREAKAGALVTREGRQFHERQAKRFGVHTSRGLAHFKASKMYTREGNRLQEMFEKSGGQGQLPPKAIMKASKAAMLFHKKCAEKAGLDSDLGHAHVAQMEHHADMFKKAKGQHQQAGQQNPEEANMGHSGKQSPVPVPKKSEQPSDDIRQNKPMMRLQQNESAEGGPGSGPRKSGEGSGKLQRKIRNTLKKSGYEEKEDDRGVTFIHPKSGDNYRVTGSGKWSHSAGDGGTDVHSLAKHLGIGEKTSGQDADRIPYNPYQNQRDKDKAADKKELTPENYKKKYGSKESGRGPDNSMSNTFPSKVSKQVKNELVFRGKKQKMFDPRMNRDKSMKRSKESRQDDDAPKQIDLRDFYKQEEKGTGWKNSNVYSPTKLRENQQASNVVIKEY